MGLRFTQIYKNMSMMCFAQNKKQIMHFRNPSYPSVSAVREEQVRVLSVTHWINQGYKVLVFCLLISIYYLFSYFIVYFSLMVNF